MSYLSNFDQKTQATQKAQVVDQKLGVSSKGYAAFNMVTSYFDKAASTPTGQKLRAFYEQGNKTVMDVHNEARHLADLKKQKPASEEGAASAEAQEKPKEAVTGEKSGSDSFAAAHTS
jgi:hypothetical protein